MKARLVKFWKSALVKQAVSAAENWAVRAVLAYLVAKQAAPHSVP